MEETTRRWPDPDQGPYVLTLRWSRRDGRPVVTGLHLDLDGEEGPALNTSLMRELKLAEILIEEREKLAHLPQVKPPAEAAITGMRPSTIKRLSRAAEVYMEAWRAGEPPTKAVGYRMNVTPAAAANLVRRAREVGLLPKTQSGVPQG